MPTLVISHRGSGRVVRKACASREQAWEMADRAVQGWLRKVQGSRYQDPRAPRPSRAVAVRSRRVPLVFEVISP
jgi:hypothetical protein